MVHREFEPEHPIEATLIKVDDLSCLAMLLNLVNASLTAKQGIEQPNYVAASVTLPDDIYLGAFAYIGERVKLGKNVKIYPQVYVGNDVTIGDKRHPLPGCENLSQLRNRHNCTLHEALSSEPTVSGSLRRPTANMPRLPR